MDKVPCNGCQDRHMGCHGKCEKYQAYRNDLTKENERLYMIKSNKRTDKRWFEQQFRKRARSGY